MEKTTENEDRNALLAQKLYFALNRHLGVLCRDYNQLLELADEIRSCVEISMLDKPCTIKAEAVLMSAYKIPPISQKTQYEV